MTTIVADFEALPLDAKLKAYPEITAALNAARTRAVSSSKRRSGSSVTVLARASARPIVP